MNGTTARRPRFRRVIYRDLPGIAQRHQEPCNRHSDDPHIFERIKQQVCLKICRDMSWRAYPTAQSAAAIISRANGAGPGWCGPSTRNMPMNPSEPPKEGAGSGTVNTERSSSHLVGKIFFTNICQMMILSISIRSAHSERGISPVQHDAVCREYLNPVPAHENARSCHGATGQRRRLLT